MLSFKRAGAERRACVGLVDIRVLLPACVAAAEVEAGVAMMTMMKLTA